MIESFAAVLLTQGKWAIIDYEDWERVRAYRWCASNKRSWHSRDRWYAIRKYTEAGRAIYVALHYFVLGLDRRTMSRELRIDHKNNDSLDCRKANLEVITHQENMYRAPGWKRARQTVEEPAL